MHAQKCIFYESFYINGFYLLVYIFFICVHLSLSGGGEDEVPRGLCVSCSLDFSPFYLYIYMFLRIFIYSCCFRCWDVAGFGGRWDKFFHLILSTHLKVVFGCIYVYVQKMRVPVHA